ncbi:MAG TPA: hypothetical protein VF023_01440 [Bryobacteraceae bacterium]
MALIGMGLLLQPTALDSIVASGRCLTVAETPSERVNPKPSIAPGLPPLLSFRYYEGRNHHRFSQSDLVLDDAGH